MGDLHAALRNRDDQAFRFEPRDQFADGPSSLRADVAAHAWDRVAPFAHTLKGRAGLLGMGEISAIAGRLEAAAHAGDFVRAERLLIALEAHLRQRIYANLSLAQKQAGPLIVGNRSLELAMAPCTDLFTAAAEQGATTKRAVAKALKKSGKKGKKAAGGASEAKDEGGQDSKATPPVKDAPPARDPR